MPHYSPCSLHGGGTTCAFKAKVPESLMQLQGDWASACYKRYHRVRIAEKKVVAQNMASCVLAARCFRCDRLRSAGQ